MHRTFFMDHNEASAIFDKGSWQDVVLSEFSSQLLSDIRPFPCVFGVQGLRDNQLRFVFQDSFNAYEFSESLCEFVRQCRGFGQNTSLVLFIRPEVVADIGAYHTRFWNILAEMAAIDPDPWPDHVPHDTNEPMWEFCFAGEPIFVVCNTPAHVLRQSRRSSGMMLTFQPRWVFDNILGTERAAKKAFAAVRSKLERYDLIEASPSLGKYGDADNLEAGQYFLDEENKVLACPFSSLVKQNNIAA